MSIKYASASTLQLSRFIKFHNDLNSYVKLSVSAIDHLMSYMGDDGLPEKISALITSAGERWTPVRFSNPIDAIKQVRRQIPETALMRVTSAFDQYLSGIEGTYSHLKNTSKEDETGTNLERLYQSFRWPLVSINYLIPVFNFYNELRNCIAHQMAYPNESLMQMYEEGGAFKQAVAAWPTKIGGRKLSPPPKVLVDDVVELMPHHAITFSDVCLRVARDIDKKIFEALSPEYFAKKISTDILRATPRARASNSKDAYRYIKEQLRLDYRIEASEIQDIKQLLGDDLAKKCFKKFADLHGHKSQFEGQKSKYT